MFMAGLMLSAMAQLTAPSAKGERKMWASITTGSGNGGSVSLGDYQAHNGKILLSWRMLPTDTWDTSFYIYRRPANKVDGTLGKVTSSPVTTTNFQLSGTSGNASVPTSDYVYYLVPSSFFEGRTAENSYMGSAKAADRLAIRQAAVDSLLLDARVWSQKLPYITIPLQSTEDVSGAELANEIKYQANDCSVGDLDGDGEMEVVVKRLLTIYNAEGTVVATSEGAGDTDSRARHIIVWDAYKLDGTMLWRVKSGPNIIAGNSSAVTLGDLDGDGCAEFVLKTSEGTVFGDGKEIPDTDGDNKTDYRDRWPSGHYTGDGPKGYGGPEFFSVVDGKTGKELARANYIARGKEGETPAQLAANWEANDWKWDPRSKKYIWKLANSLRMGLANFKGGDKGLQIFLGRGVYGRTIVEGWEYAPTPNGDFEGTLTRMWKLDTDASGGHWSNVDGVWTKDNAANKDGKPYSAYAGQGNHAFNVADLDGDGKDEVMYGSCAFDDDGTGLWSTGLGHGDANHVGRFLPDREGLQVFHCLETGKCEVALHDAKDGSIIWAKYSASDGDQGRCMTADVDPRSPGYEFWMYGNELFTQDGTELMNSEGTARAEESSANAGIWFDGYLNRQMIDDGIINSYSHGRTFTMYRFDISFNNSTKSNPGWYGDFLGDWREEVIVPSSNKLTDIKIFSTWYPSDYKLPYLMSDHTYMMQCIHENVGYNQPTNVGGYYLGSDMDFSKVPLVDAGDETAIEGVQYQMESVQRADGKIYDLTGREVQNITRPGIYIRNGRKFVVK